MTAEVVNLRRARKARARGAAETAAARNRAAYGTPRALREAAAATDAKAARHLDGHRRVRPGSDEIAGTDDGQDNG